MSLAVQFCASGHRSSPPDFQSRTRPLTGFFFKQFGNKIMGMSGVPNGPPEGTASLMSLPSSVCRNYTEQEILTESPPQLVLTLLDFILDAVRRKHSLWVRRGFQTLLDSLDYRYEMSWDLQTLYEACLALVEQGHFTEAYSVLYEFRTAWGKAFRLGSLESSVSFLRAVRRNGFEIQV